MELTSRLVQIQGFKFAVLKRRIIMVLENNGCVSSNLRTGMCYFPTCLL